MVRFLKAVQTVDKITDCIPVISTIKNASILLYQRAHKVNKVNPVNTSWVDDLKIHALSKNMNVAKLAMIPVLGNLVAMIESVTYALGKRGTGQMGYLAEASRQWNPSLQKHGYEVTALYLARNPNRSEKSLGKALAFAASANSPEVFALIFNSRSDWTLETITTVLGAVNRIEDAQLVLSKYKTSLTPKHIEEILSYHLAIRLTAAEQFERIKFMLDEFPDVKPPLLENSLVGIAGNREMDAIFTLFIERFKNINQKHLDAALKKAAREGAQKQVALLLEKSSGSNVAIAVRGAASSINTDLFDWLLTTYSKKITTGDIGKALSTAIMRWYRLYDMKRTNIHVICEKFANLPAEDLKAALTAVSDKPKFLALLLNTFTEIRAEHVQTIFNNAKLILAHPTNDQQIYEKVVNIIKAKFPDIQAT